LEQLLLSHDDFLKYVEETNNEFRSCNDVQRRKMVAKDIIYLIDLKSFTPTHGVYINLHEAIYDKDILDSKTTLSEALQVKPEALSKCQCCAIGAGIFAYHIRDINKAKESLLDINDIDSFSNPKDITYCMTNSGFSLSQCEIIESAFELSDTVDINGPETTKLMRDLYQMIIDDSDGEIKEQPLIDAGIKYNRVLFARSEDPESEDPDFY